MTIPELIEASNAAMIIAETYDLNDMRRLVSALRAQTLMLQAQVIQNASGGKEAFMKLLRERLTNRHFDSTDRFGLKDIIEAPFGALVVMDYARLVGEGMFSPLNVLIAVAPFRQAGWGVQVRRASYSGGYEACKSHDRAATCHVGSEQFCERCCQLVEVQSPNPP